MNGWQKLPINLITHYVPSLRGQSCFCWSQEELVDKFQMDRPYDRKIRFFAPFLSLIGVQIPSDARKGFR